MAELFREGGAAMGFIVLFAVGALVFAILHAALARRWTLVAAAIQVPLPLLAGLAGWILGRVAVAEAVAFADAGFAQELAEIGYAEARIPLVFGAIAFCACLVPFAIGVARQVRRLAG
jgi:hypothetical protein